MSLSRIFAPELRPFFRALDDPFGRGSLASAFNHPLFNDPNFRRTDSGISPAVDVTESADGYVVHAEIPGVAKENINVSLSDAGRSLNINGRVVLRQGGTDTDEAAAPAPAAAPSHDTAPPPTEAPKKEEGTKLYNERTFVQDTTFSRTIHLPYPVDPTGVKAKLEHGVLTVTLSKLHDNDNKAIVID